jgi:hypothetical protein
MVAGMEVLRMDRVAVVLLDILVMEVTLQYIPD